MKIKFASAAAAVAFAFAAQTAYAEDAPAPAPTPEITITGSADIASQYRFRGISQSDNKPVAQAAITVTDKSGFYISFWGSSASSATNAPVNIGGTEIDIFGGYGKTINGFALDGGVYGYIYPGSASVNGGVSDSYVEIYGDVSRSYGPVTAKVGVNWAPKQAVFNDFNTTSKYSVYEYAELSLAVPSTPITLHSHLGHTGGGFNYAAAIFPGAAGKEYLDYTVGATYKYKSLTLDASVVGTNVGKSINSYAGDYAHRLAKAAGVVTLTASF